MGFSFIVTIVPCEHFHYRPQTKFSKVMFSQVSVHGGGALGLCPGGVSVSVQGGGSLSGRPPWTETPHGNGRGGAHSTGMHSC